MQSLSFPLQHPSMMCGQVGNKISCSKSLQRTVQGCQQFLCVAKIIYDYSHINNTLKTVMKQYLSHNILFITGHKSF